jgi:hypothetical protein
LEHAESFILMFTTLQIKGRLAGFSIHEILDQQFAITHFEKALPIHRNAYLPLINKAAADLVGNSCKYVNWEQDLGLEGLRKSKQSYQPVKFLKKYIVTPR